MTPSISVKRVECKNLRAQPALAAKVLVNSVSKEKEAAVQGILDTTGRAFSVHTVKGKNARSQLRDGLRSFRITART
jgi:hypothetical protein